MPYAIIRFEKRKIGAVTSIEKHHERQKWEYKSNPDIDMDRIFDNYHIVEPHDTYRKMVLKRIEDVGAKRRKDSVVMVDGLIAGTPDWITTKPIEEQKEYFNYAYEFIKQLYGEENIISAVVHLDEATPHMHFCFVPITKDNRLSAKDIIKGPRGLTELQNKFYKHMHEKYPELDRGLPKRDTKREHVPMYVFKAADRLFDHYNEITKAIQDIGLIKNQQQKDKALTLLAKYAPEMAELKIHVDGIDDRIRFLEKEVWENQWENSSISDKSRKKDKKIEDLTQTVKQKEDKIKELAGKLDELMGLIDEVPPQILEKLLEKKSNKPKKVENRRSGLEKSDRSNGRER